MIRFACKKCGKRHKQPADAAGSLVFCECGQANRVPWESTAPQEPAAGEPRPRPRRSKWSDAEEDDERESAPRGRRKEARRRDPAYCLNHDETPSVHTCPDCDEAFCPRCLVEFQNLRLCGPCKNFRVRQLQRRPKVAGMAVAGLVAGLGCIPLVFCMTWVPATQGAGTGALFGLGAVGMVIGSAALLLGLLGLREAERKAARGGHGLALTGAALGTSALLWSLSLVVIMVSRFVGG